MFFTHRRFPCSIFGVMDPHEILTATENVLRDLVDEILRDRYGDHWIEARVDDQTRERWQQRLVEERARREGAQPDDRLIYYAELVDPLKLFKQDWQLFSPCFGDWKTMELDFSRLIAFRHPNHHGRRLLPFERDLLTGITGSIRNRVTIFRSERGPDKEYFPRIEYVEDSFGNVARKSRDVVSTGLTLRPGDEVTFSCRGWDPKGEPLNWHWNVHPHVMMLEREAEADEFVWAVEIGDIAETKVYMSSC